MFRPFHKTNTILYFIYTYLILMFIRQQEKQKV